VRTVEQIVDQIRAAAGGDFAFVLTRKGRLVTYRAPRDMPEVGRNRLVRAARPLLGTDRILAVTLPREELVPYGGAAPVDVYLGVAAEQAIVCVALATWADARSAEPALSAGLRAIEPLLRRGLPVNRRPGDLGPAKGTPYTGDRRTRPPPSMLPPLPGEAPADVPLPRPESLPEIHVAEAELGRLSMAAVRHDVAGTESSPEITFGDSELGRQSMVAVRRELIGAASAPEIMVTGEASLGRESLAAIQYEGKVRPTSSPDAIRIDLASMPSLPDVDVTFDEGEPAPQPGFRRAINAPATAPGGRATMPWVEPAADAKRAADAAILARRVAPPKVTLKLEEVDESVLDAAKAEMGAPPNPPRAPQPTVAYEAGPILDPKAAKRA
jgi:hypothetical protein